MNSAFKFFEFCSELIPGNSRDIFYPGLANRWFQSELFQQFLSQGVCHLQTTKHVGLLHGIALYTSAICTVVHALYNTNA